MRSDETDIRAYRSSTSAQGLVALLFALLCICAAAEQTGDAQQQQETFAGKGPLTTEEVVGRLEAMNIRRAQALHSYHGTRTYRLEYRNSLKTVAAEMFVEVNYLAPETKDFTIQSSTGSKLIIDKVFRKILQAEEDTLSADAQRSTALSFENYDFTMVGYEETPSRPMYVLVVEPKTQNKFLFRGRVWVDADDFAVVRIEAEPAKSPSFWTKSSKIEQSYLKVNDFWLPARNHSISAIRLGGRAELTIEYGDYQITEADPFVSAPTQEIAGSADTSRTPNCSQASLRQAPVAGPCLSPAGSVRNQHQRTDRSPKPADPLSAASEVASWK